MNPPSDSKCSAKAIWLSLYFVFQVLGFTACLLALVSPSWQFVYLEEGRTEHQHGLWLDCKRDYSNEYGRPREYYEKLFRLDHMQGPFDQFSLPPLLCVYKFDYWIDEEDLYEHGYDENRLQDDAYQHLFLGWKIAALTALTFSLVCSLSALIICVCAFCHRLLVCVSTVLSTLTVITCTIGNMIFFMYARYQDNNIIKQDEGIYEQYFGWSFYTSLLGNTFLFFAAVLGCVSTSVVMSLGKAKLVKIEVEENDSRQLLSANSSDQPFKRSFSAVYKIDSSALRKWERECMKSIRKNNFQRANSMPNIKKGNMRSRSTTLQLNHSTSDISKAFTDPTHFVTERSPSASPPSPAVNGNASLAIQYTALVPTEGNVFPGSTNNPVYPPPRISKQDDVVYEYVEHGPPGCNFTKLDTSGRTSRSPPITGTTINVYDEVATQSSTSYQQSFADDDSEYLKPKNTNVTTISSVVTPFTTKSTKFEDQVYEMLPHDVQVTSFGTQATNSHDSLKAPVRSTIVTPLPARPASTFPTQISLRPLLPKPIFEDKGGSDHKVVINTFNNNEKSSLVNLFKHSPSTAQPITVFDHSGSMTPRSTVSDADKYGEHSKPVNSKLLYTVLRNEAANSMGGVKETNIDWSYPSSAKGSRTGSIASNSSLLGYGYVPSEMDRSVGSSIVQSASPSQQRFYDLNMDDSVSTKSLKGETTCI